MQSRLYVTLIHAAKIGIFRLTSKLLCNYLQVYIPQMCSSPKFFDNSFCIKRMFLHRKLLFLHRFLWFLGPKTVMICAFQRNCFQQSGAAVSCKLLIIRSLMEQMISKRYSYSCYSYFFEGCLSLYIIYNYLYINKLYTIIRNVIPSFFTVTTVTVTNSAFFFLKLITD